MLKRVFSKILLGVVLSTTMLLNQPLCVKASTNLSENKVPLLNEKASIRDVLEIKKNINTVLSLKYEIMKDLKFKSSDTIVKDSDLLNLIDTTNKFKVDWYKKTNFKIFDYKSFLNIDDIQTNSKDDYIVNVTYSVELINDVSKKNISKSDGEKYRFEVKKQNNKWYIVKMLDINDAVDAQNNKNTMSISSSDNTISKNFPDYNNMIKNKIKTINSIYENIDNYAKEQKNIEQPRSIVSAASSYSGYLSTNAVNYALTWATSYNPNFVNYGDEDCTNYVSQCVYAGSIPSTSYWYSRSYAWINVIGFYNYMKSNGYTYGGDSQDSARLGDVVQLYNSSKQTWAHSVILTAQDPMGWRYCGHSNFRYNWPLRDVYPSSTYTQARYIKFWH